MKAALVLLALLPLIALGQIPTDALDLDNFPTSLTVGFWSDWIYIRPAATNFPKGDVSITITSNDLDGAVEISPSTVVLRPTMTAASFRILARNVGPLKTVSFSLSDSASQFITPLTRTFTSTMRSIQLDTFSLSARVNMPSEPVRIYLSHPSASDLTIVPSINDTSFVTFTPSAVTIPRGSLSGSFRFISSVAGEFPRTTVTFAVSGDEKAFYNDIPNSFGTFSSSRRSVAIEIPNGAVLARKASNKLHMWAPVRPNVSLPVTITPTAADTIFTPTSIELTSGDTIPTFTFTTDTTKASKRVDFFISGPGAADFDEAIPSRSISVPKRPIDVLVPSTMAFSVKSKLHIRIPDPTPKRLTVTISAANLKFNPSSVTFSGETTAITVEVEPLAVGPDTLSFWTSDDDIDLYAARLIEKTVSVTAGEFTGPREWYTPSLWLGQESDEIPIRVTMPPQKSVTLTPYAPHITFKPASLTFTPKNLEQTFTMTPTGVANSDELVSNSVVNFAVSGADYAIFSAPNSFSISVARRTIQARWSSEIELASSPKTLYLGKEHSLWISANYVGSGETVTVTPVNPHFTFKPATVTLSSKNARKEVKAIPKHVTPATTTISYILGGDEGGLYLNIAPQDFTVALRPIGIFSAFLAADNDAQGVYLTRERRYDEVLRTTVPALVDPMLVRNHVVHFTVATGVIPDGKLTITPRSAHVKFHPSKVELTSDDLKAVQFVGRDIMTASTSTPPVTEPADPRTTLASPVYAVVANFTAKAQAPGIHDVYFELSGSDGKYYDNVPHTPMLFRKYSSSSSRVAFSVAGLLAFVALVLVM